MKEQNIDALLMFRQESMYWLTGYDTFGYVFFQTLILDKNGNTILLTRAPDLRQAQNTSNIEDIRIWVDKDGSNPSDDLRIILDELNLKGKKLGVEYEAYGLTGRNALRLNKSLENVAIEVLVENKMEKQNKLFGRNKYISPVIFNGDECHIGKVVKVKIQNSNQNTLFGVLDKKMKAA